MSGERWRWPSTMWPLPRRVVRNVLTTVVTLTITFGVVTWLAFCSDRRPPTSREIGPPIR